MHAINSVVRRHVYMSRQEFPLGIAPRHDFIINRDLLVGVLQAKLASIPAPKPILVRLPVTRPWWQEKAPVQMNFGNRIATTKVDDRDWQHVDNSGQHPSLRDHRGGR